MAVKTTINRSPKLKLVVEEKSMVPMTVKQTAALQAPKINDIVVNSMKVKNQRLLEVLSAKNVTKPSMPSSCKRRVG